MLTEESIKEKLGDMEESIKTIAEYVKNQIDTIKDNLPTKEDIEDLERKIEESRESKPSYEYERRVEDLENEIKDLKRSDSRREVPKIKEEVDEALTRVKRDLESRLKGYEEKLREQKDLSYLRSQTEDLRKTMQNMKALIDRVSIESNSYKNLAEDLTNLRNFVDEINSQREHLNKQLQDLQQQLRFLRAGSIPDKAATKGELTNLEKKIAEFEEKLNSATASNLSDAYMRRMDDLESEIRQLRKMPDSKPIILARFKQDVEENIKQAKMDIESRLQAYEAKLAQNEERIALASKQIDLTPFRTEVDVLRQNLEDMRVAIENLREQRATPAVAGPDEELIDEINDLRSTLDEETTNRISIDKTLQDMQQQLKDLRSRQPAETRIDYNKLLKMLQTDKQFSEEVERRAKLETVNLITKHLDDFAHTLDKRFPNIATKDDLAQIERKMEQKMRMPIRMEEETISRRLDELEGTMNTLINALRTVQYSQRNPFVIE